MAYTDYSPSETFDATISIPDDAELESAGIAAVNTPLEQLADRTEYNAERVFVDGNKYGTIDTSAMSLKDTTAVYKWPETMIDANAEVGDRFVVTYSLTVVTTSPTPSCYVSLEVIPAATAPLGTELQELKVFSATRTHMVMQGYYVAVNAGVHEFQLTFKNDGAGAALGVDVYDIVTVSLVRYRP